MDDEFVLNQWVDVKRLLYDLIQKVDKMASDLDTRITQLQTDVTAQKGTVASALTLLQGLSAALQDVLAKLTAAGVTPAQLQSLVDLDAAVVANTQSLAAGVAANPVPPTP